MNITIKSIPEEVGLALKGAAKRSGRSLNREIIHRLSQSLKGIGVETAAAPDKPRSPDEVADAWLALAGRWRSDATVEAEIESLYASRSAGRDWDASW